MYVCMYVCYCLSDSYTSAMVIKSNTFCGLFGVIFYPIQYHHVCARYAWFLGKTLGSHYWHIL